MTTHSSIDAPPSRFAQFDKEELSVLGHVLRNAYHYSSRIGLGDESAFTAYDLYEEVLRVNAPVVES